MRHTVRTICNRDCPDSCAVLATVEDGRIVEHVGDPDHGITRGFLCQRGNRYLERQYSPDRVLHPMQRTAAGWRRVSWDDALDLAAGRLVGIREESGPTAVAHISYSGIKGLVARTMGRLFWAHFGGGTFTEGGLSVEAIKAAQELDMGGDGTHAPEDLVNSAAVVVWGKNIAVTRPHGMRFVADARRGGAPLWVIDPVRCATARRADRHLQLRPGTDGWLALAVGRLLIEADAVDLAFVTRRASGWEAYRAAALATDVDEVARICDLPRADIEALSELYATTRPLATLAGLGASYWRHAGTTMRLIDALGAMTGNVGVPGGGVQTDTSAYQGMDFSAMTGAPKGETRRVLLPRLGDAILAAADPPIRAAWIAGANPAATAPDTARVQEGLASLEFLVVVDHFLTASCEHAHLFLPCTTYLEMEDLVTAYGHHWLGMTQAVVPPEGEARPDTAIYQALASRFGFGEALAGTPREWSRTILGELTDHGITPETLVERPRPNPLAPAVPWPTGEFGTGSGRFEFVSGFELPLPGGDGPELRLMATKTVKMVNAQINDRELVDEPTVRLHPDTLAGRGLEPGRRAWLVSDTGRVRVRLAVDPHARRDLVLFNPAAWRGDLQGVNQLRASALTDIGQGAAMHETRVRLVPGDAEDPRATGSTNGHGQPGAG